MDFSRTMLEQYSADLRQFIGFREAVLPSGMRVIDAYNASGLALTLLPDRGLDIWAATFNGKPLTWLSAGSPHAPDWSTPWLALFNGGLLATCGLQHVGPPEHDDQTGLWRDLHGQYTRLRAYDVRASGAWEDTDRYAAELSGTVAEAALFGPQLMLRRTYRMVLGEPAVTIRDTVTNHADGPYPLMLLYHLNFGYPLVSEGAVLHVPDEAVYARDEPARRAFADWPNYHAARPGHAEEVYFHHVRADADGMATAALLQPDLGLQITWDTRTAPYLTQWKNFRQGMYVCGIEPGNCIPEGANAAREKGRLVMLEPGESQAFSVTLRMLEGAAAVENCKKAVEALAQEGTAVAGCHLPDYAGV